MKKDKVKKKVSNAVIKRLPKYYKCISKLIDCGIEKISSNDLSDRMKITPSQIRQDLNNFGCFGTQGYGYELKFLLYEIEKILGLDRKYNMILVGYGNLGKALIDYKEFKRKGFEFKGIFDINKEIINSEVNGIKIYDMSEMESFMEENKIDIVVLTVPKEVVNKIYLEVLKYEIKGVWNYTQEELEPLNGIKVEQVHLMESLMMLSYKVNE